MAASLLAFGAPRYYGAEYHPFDRGALLALPVYTRKIRHSVAFDTVMDSRGSSMGIPIPVKTW